MTFTPRKVAAVAAAAALTMAGLPGIANAQGLLDSGSLGLVSDSLEGGSVQIVPDANAGGEGSLNTEGSTLIGEPSTGSLAPLAGSVAEATGSVNVLNPAPGTGSIDTTDSLIGEPTTGSLAPLYAPVAGSLGIGEGATTIIQDPGGLGSVVLGLGSVAAIGAGIAFAPQIQQALADAGIVLPP
ncbi:hypothetical protein ES5_01849, partial [Dietzia cinnamea P4]